MRRVTLGLLSCVLVAASVARADQTVSAAYRAILNGDYETGRTALSQIDVQAENATQATRAQGWLESYLGLSTTRDKLRDETFRWNMDQAKQALERGQDYLSLSFTSQASLYAADPAKFADGPWVRDLRSRSLTVAGDYLKEEKWSRAYAHYTLLLRVNEKDEEVEQLRDRSARHLRLQGIYKDDETIRRRLKDVTTEMLVTAIDKINDQYYQEPDFKSMAEGALDNLIALCHTTKLYDASSVFDGIADPLAREHFLSKLEALRQELKQREDFGHRGLLAVFNQTLAISGGTVSLPAELMIVEFLEGSLNELDDFTSVVWPDDLEQFNKMMMGSFFGVGIQLGVDEITNRLKVVTPLENSPSLDAGVQPDDLIIEVDGVTTKDWSTDRAVREITGPEGSPVELTFFRPRTGKPFKRTLKRSRIQITTIRGVDRTDDRGKKWNYLLDKDAGIAFIRLTGFNPESDTELEVALRDARAQGMKGLILDLRSNPGGLLDVAINIVSNFLDKGEVVWTKGRREARQHHEVNGDSDYDDIPLVIMINGGSASASEILSGALQDHDRALIIGDRSFGKGSVQRVLGLNRRSWLGRGASQGRLKLTTALYYLPSNRSPHKVPGADVWGVDPDWIVKLTPKEFRKVLDRERAAYIIHNEDDGEEIDEQERLRLMEELKADEVASTDDEEDAPLLSADDIKLLRSDPFEAPDVDPQLQTALLQLRVKLAANIPWPRRLAGKMVGKPTP